ncbi:MAG TPA: response regulator transcription factor [Patescibacteria group bacterium]|nr:response regulator transcription factor [Patescibacteria group bacterium]
MTTPTTRVVLADDHTLVRSGIRRILEAHPGFEVVGEAADGVEALALVRETVPDVIVLDLNMPGSGGLDALPALKLAQPSLKVVVLSMHAGREYVSRAMKGGADAYLLKDSAVQDLVAAVEAVLVGRSYFSPSIQALMAELLRGETREPSRGTTLTDREREVLGWLARGLSSKEVAQRLDISVRTVETHRANLMHKLGVKSVALLIQVALREGIIDPSPPT